jgi:uncharacterized protein
VIVVDANLLIYAYDSRSPDHKKSLAWMTTVFSGAEIVGLPWQVISAFVRVVTNRRLAEPQLNLEQAVRIVDDWLEQPNVRLLVPGEQYWRTFRTLLLGGQAAGPLVSDAEIAALTVEYGGVLYTADRDFARFPGLRWANPLS